MRQLAQPRRIKMSSPPRLQATVEDCKKGKTSTSKRNSSSSTYLVEYTRNSSLVCITLHIATFSIVISTGARLRKKSQMANPYSYNYPPQDVNMSDGRGRYEPDYGSNHSYAPSPDDHPRRESHLQGYGGGQQYNSDPDGRSHRGSHRQQNYDDDSDSASSSEDERPAHRSSRKGSHSSHLQSRDHQTSTDKVKPLDKAKEHFSTSDRGVGAGMLGAIAGAVVAQETAQRNGKGSIGATIAGLVLGGLAGNALENRYDK